MLTCEESSYSHNTSQLYSSSPTRSFVKNPSFHPFLFSTHSSSPPTILVTVVNLMKCYRLPFFSSDCAMLSVIYRQQAGRHAEVGISLDPCRKHPLTLSPVQSIHPSHSHSLPLSPSFPHSVPPSLVSCPAVIRQSGCAVLLFLKTAKSR